MSYRVRYDRYDFKNARYMLFYRVPIFAAV